jgi:hypothetical protein
MAHLSDAETVAKMAPGNPANSMEVSSCISLRRATVVVIWAVAVMEKAL